MKAVEQEDWKPELGIKEVKVPFNNPILSRLYEDLAIAVDDEKYERAGEIKKQIEELKSL